MKNEFKGTPGQFSIKVEAVDQTVEIQICGGGKVLTSVTPWFEENPDIDECMANAHLFAASPKLLKALQALIKDYDDFREKTGSSHMSQNEMMLTARAAIKQALELSDETD